MSDNVKVLVVGAGLMAKEYCKVLQALHREPIVIGRSEDGVAQFQRDTGIKAFAGGLEKNITEIGELPDYAIVAIDILQLSKATKCLLNNGITNILVEKPGGVTRQELEEVCDLAAQKMSNVFVAYNRRYYASTQKALEMIKEDGGVSSFHFEFTEWAHVIANTGHPKEVKEKTFFGNSTHVLDLAFFLGGFPKEISSYVAGSLEWHSSGCIYSGSGISDKGALFSYQANWAAPGRWAVEILTNSNRLYFKPLETLQVQELRSVAVKPVEIDDKLDRDFKPGLYKQVQAFLKNIDDGKRLTIAEQLDHWRYYEIISKYSGSDRRSSL